MDTAMTLNWLEMRRTTSVRTRQEDHQHGLRLVRENIRLAEENERLRAQLAALAASTEIWIRLYEAALARANEAGRGVGRFQ
jgi:hypothetical protein